MMRHNPPGAAAVKAAAQMWVFRVTLTPKTAVLARPEPFQHIRRGKSVRGCSDRGLEPTQGFPGLAAKLTVRRTAVKTALGQQLLQFQPLGPRQFALLPRPGLHEGRTAAQAVGEMPDRQ